MVNSRSTWYVFIIAVLLVLLGGGLAAWTQTSGLTVDINDVRFMATNGQMMSALLTVAIPTLTFLGGQHTANDWIKPSSATSPVTFWPVIGSSPLWPQTITTGLMGWAVINGVITLVLFTLWHFLLNKKTGATAANYGVTWAGKGLDWAKIGKSLLLSIVITGSAYLLLAFSDWAFKTDFRLWVVALKPMSWTQFVIFLGYLIPFAFFFLVLSTALHGQLSVGSRLRREMIVNAALLAIGFVLLLLFQYIPFLSGGLLGVSNWSAGGEALLTIVAFQFVPLMVIVALISTYFYRKTGHIYTGAFINALFITWYIVAGQATHFAV